MIKNAVLDDCVVFRRWVLGVKYQSLESFWSKCFKIVDQLKFLCEEGAVLIMKYNFGRMVGGVMFV